jgi:CheY-like chemotaxis protein
VKFTPADGEVRVSLARERDALVLAVADTGAGMDPRFVPQLFQRFQQADGSTARRFGGLGLGLAIVKQLVEIHGGTVEAHSPGPGLGSTFIVRIPAIDAPAMHSRSTADAEVAAARDRALAGARVLVVEDDADAREFIARLLREWGAMVRTAGSVSEALDEVKRDSPQLLVSDIGMPGEDGYALMRHVRGLSDRDARRVPAVALTAYARAEDRLKALQAGFDIHVPKPVEPAELLAVCSTLLSRAGERKG